MVEVAVVTVSDRVAAGAADDVSGPAAVFALVEAGHQVTSTVVADEPDQITEAVRAAVAAGGQVVLTTGGTGITPRDVTPQTVAALCTYEVPGVADEVRRRSAPRVPTAMLSRAVSGVVEMGSRRAFVLTAPGSVGGVRDTVSVLLEVIDHVVDQLGGGDHPRPIHGDPRDGDDGDDGGGSLPRPGPVARPTA